MWHSTLFCIFVNKFLFLTHIIYCEIIFYNKIFDWLINYYHIQINHYDRQKKNNNNKWNIISVKCNIVYYFWFFSIKWSFIAGADHEIFD